MKSSVVLVSIILFSVFVIAEGEMRTLDFSNSSSFLVQLRVGDGVRFDWAENNHKVVVRNADTDQQRVELTNFIEGSSVPYYTSVTPRTFLELDFDRDDVKDMKVSLVKFVDDTTIILLFEKLSEPKVMPKQQSWWPNITGFFSTGPFKNAYYNMGLVVLIVVVLLVLLFSSRFIRRKYRRIRRSMMIG